LPSPPAMRAVIVGLWFFVFVIAAISSELHHYNSDPTEELRTPIIDDFRKARYLQILKSDRF
jgi:hypothetical protein